MRLNRSIFVMYKLTCMRNVPRYLAATHVVTNSDTSPVLMLKKTYVDFLLEAFIFNFVSIESLLPKPGQGCNSLIASVCTNPFLFRANSIILYSGFNK
jgi:hypothetical protein